VRASKSAGHDKSPTDLVRITLRNAIMNGAYEAGDLLPSSREMADRFRINRNTVNRIYRELASEGLLEPRLKGPPRVAPGHRETATVTFRDRMREALWPLLHEWQIRGIPQAEIRDAVDGIVREFSTRYRTPRVLVAECNPEDAQRYARQLSAALPNSAVSPILLDQLHAEATVDLVAVPWFHLSEVRAILGDLRDRAEGLVVSPVMQDVSDLVARVTGGPVAVVAGTRGGAERLEGLLRFYLQTPFLAATIDAAGDLAAVVAAAEIVACTPRCQSQVEAAGGAGKTRAIRYRIDPASVELLHRRLASSSTISP